MQLTNFKNLNMTNLFNFLLCFLPISFILGNLAININLVLLIIFSVIFFKNNILKFKLTFADKIVIVIFLFSFLSGLINFYLNIKSDFISPEVNLKILLKSILFSKYLLLYFSIRVIIEEKIFNFKFFFISASLCAIFVSLDLFLQFTAGQDLFGNLKSPYKNSGPFGDELIAGSYLQRFSIFCFIFIVTFLKTKNKKFLFIFLIFLFILVFSSMLIAGNRMPTILFLLLFGMLFSFKKNLRKFLIILTVFVTIIFSFMIKVSPQLQSNTQNLIESINDIIVSTKVAFVENKKPDLNNTYVKEFYSGYAAWNENVLIGGGIDSFYINCAKTVFTCASHPHNYYLEILSELGILGFILIMILFINTLWIIYNKNIFGKYTLQKQLTIPFVLLFLIEIFPIKTSGSFFTTGNASFIFFILAVIISLSKRKI